MSNSFGQTIRVGVFGQSHSPCIGVTIEGLPAGMSIDMDAALRFMARRAPGQNELTTPRREADRPRIVSGLNDEGLTCGSPLCALIDNADTRSRDYDELRRVPRPGHADYPAYVKYGAGRDVRGGGQFSGRMTAPLCFAGAICLQMLKEKGIEIGSHLKSVGPVDDMAFDPVQVDAELLASLREKQIPTIDDAAGERMRDAVREARDQHDSVGGIIEACALNLPVGLGEPMFGGLENQLAAALFAVPAVKGVEFGEGFKVSRMRGSEHNDGYRMGDGGRVITRTNHHGGILGGLSTGMPLIVRVAFKPTSSIGLAQNSVDLIDGVDVELVVQGRHDPCVALRAAPCVEAMMAIVLADMMSGEGMLP